MTCPVCRQHVTGIDVIHRHRDGIGQMCPASGAPIHVRKHQATVDTHAERLSAETAEALVRGRRAQIASLKVRIDVGRSVGAVVRSEMDFERVRP